VTTTPHDKEQTVPRTIYAVGFQSVDPDEASIGGCQWSVDKAEIAPVIEDFRANRMECDMEFLHHTLTVPSDLTDVDDITEWVDATIWDLTPERRTVLLGGVYPGGERRRIDAVVTHR
jgi:hypothetical protein